MLENVELIVSLKKLGVLQTGLFPGHSCAGRLNPMDRVGAAEVSAADDLSGSGEGLELEAPATFWGKSGDGGAGFKPELQTYASDERTGSEMTSWHRVKSIGGRGMG